MSWSAGCSRSATARPCARWSPGRRSARPAARAVGRRPREAEAMVLSDVSIKRPVFATVVSLVLIIFGLFAYDRLSVREYPDIDPPVISVSTVYRGAAAEIVETQITQVIEDAVSGIDGIRAINSNSREESSSVSIEFTLSRDVDSAANDVRDRVARVAARLPDEADTPVVAKTEADSRPIVYLTLLSDRHDRLELSDYATRFLVDRLSIVPGVASVRILGGWTYAMRVRLDRTALAARGLTVQDVENAIRRQNVDIPSGRIESTMREFSVRTDSSLKTAEEFARIVVKEGETYLTRLGEVASVDLGPEDERTEQRTNGRSSVGLGIVRQSKANDLDISAGVNAALEVLRETLPDGVTLDVTYDRSVFIQQSIKEVYHALSVALGLVVAVIFVFLRSWRATIIPALAIPVSILGAFMVLAALGYSINVLTLLALVLAIGLVVDDAIVVLENIHRRIEEGEPPLLASLRGARQIGFAVIATTMVLIAVFVPISLMEGQTGRLFREFGISVAAAVLFSGLVALTLTPMLCSKLLKPHTSDGMLVRLTEPVFTGMTAGYRWLLRGCLAAPLIVVALGFLASMVAYLFYAGLPKEFAPTEDRGVVFIPVTGPEGASLDYLRRNVTAIEGALLQHIGDKGPLGSTLAILAPNFGRPGAVNSAFIVARLKDWDQRTEKQQDFARRLFPALQQVPGVRAFPVNPPSLGQSAIQAPVQIAVGGPTYAAIDGWVDRIIARAAENRSLLNLTKDYQPSRPQVRVRIDRDRASSLGVPVDVLGRTLETMLGAREVTQFDREGKRYKVMVQGLPGNKDTPSELSSIYVRSTTTGRLIPLSNLVSITERSAAPTLTRVDRLRAITIQATPAPGYTLDEALTYLEKVAGEELPPEARISYLGQSRDLKETSSAIWITFGLALAIVFLVLAAQFESWIHPIVIMLSVPLAITGALGAIWFAGMSFNIYSQIGVIMLIGLIAKNAILIVEFANQLRDEGQGVYEAVLEASVARLRPILMTSIATVFGAVPLAWGTGAGAESRQALGMAVVGGMTFATFLSLFVVPVLYLLLAGLTRPTGHIARSLSAMEERHRLDGAQQHPAE